VNSNHLFMFSNILKRWEFRKFVKNQETLTWKNEYLKGFLNWTRGLDYFWKNNVRRLDLSHSNQKNRKTFYLFVFENSWIESLNIVFMGCWGIFFERLQNIVFKHSFKKERCRFWKKSQQKRCLGLMIKFCYEMFKFILLNCDQS